MYFANFLQNHFAKQVLNQIVRIFLRNTKYSAKFREISFAKLIIRRHFATHEKHFSKLCKISTKSFREISRNYIFILTNFAFEEITKNTSREYPNLIAG